MSNSVCTISANLPWRVYDRFDAQGYPRPNGQMDATDLQHWVSSYIGTDGKPGLPMLDKDLPLRPMLTFAQKCGYFRLSMIYKRFLDTHVVPEMTRTTPIPPASIDATLQDMSADLDATLARLNVEVESLRRQNDQNHSTDTCGWFDSACRDQAEKLHRAGDILFYGLMVMRNYVKPSILQNLAISYRSPHGEVGQIGIFFDNGRETKVAGRPAYIYSLVEEREQELRQKGLRPGVWITHIDGKGTWPMTEKDVRLALRGPIGSVVTLTLQDTAHSPAYQVAVTRGLVPWVIRE